MATPSMTPASPEPHRNARPVARWAVTLTLILTALAFAGYAIVGHSFITTHRLLAKNNSTLTATVIPGEPLFVAAQLSSLNGKWATTGLAVTLDHYPSSTVHQPKARNWGSEVSTSRDDPNSDILAGGVFTVPDVPAGTRLTGSLVGDVTYPSAGSIMFTTLEKTIRVQLALTVAPESQRPFWSSRAAFTLLAWLTLSLVVVVLVLACARVVRARPGVRDVFSNLWTLAAGFLAAALVPFVVLEATHVWSFSYLLPGLAGRSHLLVYLIGIAGAVAFFGWLSEPDPAPAPSSSSPASPAQAAYLAQRRAMMDDDTFNDLVEQYARYQRGEGPKPQLPVHPAGPPAPPPAPGDQA